MPDSAPRAPRPPAGFIRQQYDINGVRTIVYSGGKGKPLIYLHGGGSWHGLSEFAILHPERVRKLVLCCPAGLPSPDHAGPPNLGTTLEDMYGFLVNDLRVFDAHLPKTSEEKALHAKEIAREMQSAKRFFAAGGPFNPHLERWLHRLAMPTLLVWSKADKLSPYQRSQKWMKLLPNATLKLVDKAGHLVLDESPEALDAVTEFLR